MERTKGDDSVVHTDIGSSFQNGENGNGNLRRLCGAARTSMGDRNTGS